MKIPISPLPISISPVSSSSSSSSSIHSTISSSHSSPHSPPSSPPSRRCEGLDLLVKAVYHISGSVIGVPYVQRRIIRRRKPAICFRKLIVSPDLHVHDHDDLINSNGDGELIEFVSEKVKKPRRKSKLSDSVLKPKDRRKRRSSNI